MVALLVKFCVFDICYLLLFIVFLILHCSAISMLLLFPITTLICCTWAEALSETASLPPRGEVGVRSALYLTLPGPHFWNHTGYVVVVAVLKGIRTDFYFLFDVMDVWSIQIWLWMFLSLFWLSFKWFFSPLLTLKLFMWQRSASRHSLDFAISSFWIQLFHTVLIHYFGAVT